MLLAHMAQWSCARDSCSLFDARFRRRAGCHNPSYLHVQLQPCKSLYWVLGMYGELPQPSHGYPYLAWNRGAKRCSFVAVRALGLACCRFARFSKHDHKFLSLMVSDMLSRGCLCSKKCSLVMAWFALAMQHPRQHGTLVRVQSRPHSPSVVRERDRRRRLCQGRFPYIRWGRKQQSSFRASLGTR